MDIKKLETFINLVETRNYTRTAKALHVTQPTVSHDIKAIENEIGVKLFNRNKRYVNVTQDGKAFYQKIRPLINNYYSAVQDIQKKDLADNYKIIIGYSYTPFNDLYIPIWIKKFQQIYPKAKFSIISLNHNELKQQVLSGEIDVIITTGRDAADLNNIKSYHIETESFKAIVPEKNPLCQKNKLELEDFQNEKMLFLDNNWAAEDLINLQNKVMHINNQMHITYVNDLSALNILIKAEQGIAFGLYCLYPHLNENSVYVPLDWEPQVDLVAITQKNNEKRIVYQFIKFIQEFNFDFN